MGARRSLVPHSDTPSVWGSGGDNEEGEGSGHPYMVRSAGVEFVARSEGDDLAWTEHGRWSLRPNVVLQLVASTLEGP